MKAIQLKAMVFATTNLADGSVLHLDPQHPTDNRARFPEVYEEVDADRLEREGLAERWDKKVPELDVEAALAEEDKRSDAARAALADGKPLPPDVRTTASPFRAVRAQRRLDEEADARRGLRPGANMSGQDAVREVRTATGPGEESAEEAEAAADEIEGAEATRAPARGGRSRAGQ